MKKITYTKRMMALALSVIMILVLVPMTAFADGTYTFPSLSQSGNNNSMLRYYLTDENAGDITVSEERGYVYLELNVDEGWYFEKWDTYFNGYEDRPILPDSQVEGSNPVSDEGYYTFFNQNGSMAPFVNSQKYLMIKKATNFYGDHRVTAVLKPIVTVNAGDGVEYQVTTNHPSHANLAANQTAVTYGDNATVTYTVDDKYVVTGVSANYGTNYSDNGSAVTVNSIEKPVTITISTKLKQTDTPGGTIIDDSMVTLSDDVFTYNGTEQKPTILVSYHGLPLIENTDYTVAWPTDCTNAGQKNVTIEFKGNYSGTVQKTFAINPVEIDTAVVNLSEDCFAYDGTAHQPKVTVTFNGATLREGVDYKVTYLIAVQFQQGKPSKWWGTGETSEDCIAADDHYYAVVEGMGNYYTADKFTLYAPFVIEKATVTEPTVIGKTYNGQNMKADIEDTEIYTVEGNDGGINVGKYDVILALRDAKNYKWATTDEREVTIKFEIFADTKAPAAEISIRENKWSSFLNNVTFDLFFNEAQDVTITAGDTDSGIETVAYYLSETKLEFDELNTINDWQEYNGTFQIDAEKRYVIYARVRDYAGNITYINTDGIILDKTAPVVHDIEKGGKYYGMHVFTFRDDLSDLASLKIDGVETQYAPGEPSIYITPDNAEHTITVTDKAGNVTKYTITVYKNYTVTYKVDGKILDTQIVGHGTDAILPTVPAKDGFVGKWDGKGKNITADTEIHAVYTAVAELPKPDDTDSPQTGNDSMIWLWMTLLYVSGSAIIMLTVVNRKRRYTAKR